MQVKGSRSRVKRGKACCAEKKGGQIDIQCHEGRVKEVSGEIEGGGFSLNLWGKKAFQGRKKRKSLTRSKREKEGIAPLIYLGGKKRNDWSELLKRREVHKTEGETEG